MITASTGNGCRVYNNRPVQYPGRARGALGPRTNRKPYSLGSVASWGCEVAVSGGTAEVAVKGNDDALWDIS